MLAYPPRLDNISPIIARSPFFLKYSSSYWLTLFLFLKALSFLLLFSPFLVDYSFPLYLFTLRFLLITLSLKTYPYRFLSCPSFTSFLLSYFLTLWSFFTCMYLLLQVHSTFLSSYSISHANLTDYSILKITYSTLPTITTVSYRVA
jgi:hypothetical protein